MKKTKKEKVIDLTKKKLIKDAAYIEVEAPEKKVNVSYIPEKQLFVVDTKDGEIVRALMQRYGGSTPIIEVIEDMQKKYNKKGGIFLN